MDTVLNGRWSAVETASGSYHEVFSYLIKAVPETVMTRQKLVRDRIPDLMREAGISPVVQVLKPQERMFWLLLKLLEEAEEVRAEPSVEECADVWEVLKAICFELGYSETQLFEAAKAKVQRSGAFSSGILLDIKGEQQE